MNITTAKRNARKRKQKRSGIVESVWDYPRPPRVEAFPGHIRVIFNNEVIADTSRALRVLETSHPPVYYIPPDDIRMSLLVPAEGHSFCEWKGAADYLDVSVVGRTARRAAWRYRTPNQEFAAIRDHVAFYAELMGACLVNGERAVAQPGGFYGGWITSSVSGPFKGVPGSMGW
jgi:uncharacterized protein (DUF427 family)